jgi:hypothetical protein
MRFLEQQSGKFFYFPEFFGFGHCAFGRQNAQRAGFGDHDLSRHPHWVGELI